ncbi:hypothetical protein CYLTODRAFT_373303 [Cylindrobasidium torrendii FP15055 ss-10]|uniref:Uncharacterized protein n=1 Tax=Cylindrobasidium torrendii FP15055 ss-10 TaxID=1314674 RepID=A0A0D7BG71_9AGAR|nr:hypothetical protein CYLTODRAFT_373303 [Cylindrobasidium torrendii FP15055 ss-10]
MAPEVNLDPSSVQTTTWFLNTNWISPYLGLTPFSRHPDLVEQYMTEVAPKQWLLVDPATMSSLLQVIAHNADNDIPRQAAMLLALVHNNLTKNVEDSGSAAKYNDLKLKSSVGTVEYADRALCAFMLISVILFRGGRGEWNGWLNHACDYVAASFDDFSGHERQRLRSLGGTEQFLVKASIWFDVLAAISTGNPARLQPISRGLFTQPAIGVAGPAFHTSKELSMLEVMGCESHVVLALSDALGLAAWKDQQARDGTLSHRELFVLAARIEEGIHKEAKPLIGTDELSVKRHFCSEMYRTSTRLFLRSIVSGDFPGVKDIQEGVADVMAVWVQAQREENLYSQSITSAIVRMALFAFAICGALTDREDVRVQIEVVLKAQGMFGNSASLLELLRELWSTPRRRDTPVRWREALKEKNLLLV